MQGYPTLKLFQQGQAEDYQGGRTKEDLLLFLNNKAATLKPPKQVERLINQEQFEKDCKEAEGVCVIAFLPHISESGEQRRAEMVKELQKINDEQRGMPLSFFWSQGGDQFDLEESLSLGFGFPAVIALHFGKKKSATMRLSYSKENITRFIGDLLTGKSPLSNIPALLPPVKKIRAAVTDEL